MPFCLKVRFIFSPSRPYPIDWDYLDTVIIVVVALFVEE